MSSLDHYVIFLRHYNDIDHITPIINNLAIESDNNNIDVCIINDYQFKHIINYSFKNDYRIEKIKQLQNCRVHFSPEFFNIKRKSVKNINDDLITYIKSWGRKLPTRLPEQIWEAIAASTPENEKNWNKIAEGVYQELLADQSNSVVAFDWIMSPGGQGDFADHIVKRANADGHITVSLPHGDAPFINYWTTTDDIIGHDNFENSTTGIRRVIYDTGVQIEYDHIIVPNELIKSRYSHHTEDRLHVLGSPRFNEQWVQTLSELAPPFEPEVNENNHRVVIFSRKPGYTVDQKALAEAIRITAQFSDLSVVVKHHTRSPNDALHNEFKSQTGEQIGKKNNLQIVSDGVHSASLLKWGDIFVDAGTSVIFEAIVRNKPALALEYVHWNESTISHYLSESATLLSRDDLYTYMSKINRMKHLNDEALTYSAEERTTFMKELVNMGNDNVLAKYTNFLMNLSN